MTATPIDTDIRLIRAIRRRWPDRNDRAAALGITTRQLTRWEYGGEIPQIINKLAELGIITVVDEPASLPPAPAEPVAK